MEVSLPMVEQSAESNPLVRGIISWTSVRELRLSGGRFGSATENLVVSLGTNIEIANYVHIPLDPVLVPAGRAEPDVLQRFAGIMSEVFSGAPLTSEEIDGAMKKIRGRG